MMNRNREKGHLFQKQTKHSEIGGTTSYWQEKGQQKTQYTCKFKGLNACQTHTRHNECNQMKSQQMLSKDYL